MESVFNEEIHAPVRLRICGLLAHASRDFAEIRDALKLADSVISKHISRLERAGYVTIEKVLDSRRVRTRISLTETGFQAFESHVAALREIILPPPQGAVIPE